MADHRKLSNNAFKNLLDNIHSKSKDNPAEFGLTQDLVDEAKERGEAAGERLANQTTTKAAAKAATTSVNLGRKSDNDFVSDLKIKMRAANVSADKFVEVGFDEDDLTPSAIAVQIPLDLSVKGASNGTNTLKFNRNGNKQGTIFLIYAKIGAATDYLIVGTTMKTTFEHKAQKPGVKVVYQVRAQRGDDISEPSNEAVVYE